MAPANKRIPNVTIEGARIIFRNFSGKEGQYNREGDRNFAVVLPDDIAQRMIEDGWNVKYLRAREEGETDTPYLTVSVNFRGRPPRCVLITHRMVDGVMKPFKTQLPEEMVMMLDWADLSTVDLILNPYSWTVNGRSGVKAYLQAIYATVQQDELERKYADVEELPARGEQLQIEGGFGDDIIDGEVVEDDDEMLQIEG